MLPMKLTDHLTLFSNIIIIEGHTFYEQLSSYFDIQHSLLKQQPRLA